MAILGVLLQGGNDNNFNNQVQHVEQSDTHSEKEFLPLMFGHQNGDSLSA